MPISDKLWSFPHDEYNGTREQANENYNVLFEIGSICTEIGDGFVSVEVFNEDERSADVSIHFRHLSDTSFIKAHSDLDYGETLKKVEAYLRERLEDEAITLTSSESGAQSADMLTFERLN